MTEETKTGSQNHNSGSVAPVMKKTKAEQLKEYLTRPQVRDALAGVLPRHMAADRLIRIALQAASRNPRLLECTQTSILLSLVNAAQLGLEAGGLLGSAYLVPYRNSKQNCYEAQMIPGYRGLIDLARRSGEVLKIEARVVRRGDEFRLDYGADTITHVPAIEHAQDDPEAEQTYNPNDDIIGAYAVATLKGGVRQFEWMTRKEIDAIRRRSRAGDDGPWVTDYSEMARKTVVRRLAKYLPLSPEFSRAMELEDNAESGGSIRDVSDIPEAVMSSLEEPAGNTAQDTELQAAEAPSTKTEALREKVLRQTGGQKKEKEPKLADTQQVPQLPPPDPDAPGADLEPTDEELTARSATTKTQVTAKRGQGSLV